MAEKTSYSRRDFLKIVGVSSGLAVTGCKNDVPEKLIPYVIQPDEVIPGVATWYSGSCSECGAGCGLLVRNREGRAVKLEGNPAHPINSGGLCAVGQSALQGLYDPDRVREPLKREIQGSFKPVGWTEALQELAETLRKLPDTEEAVLLTGRITGSLRELIAHFQQKRPKLRHVEFSVLDRAVLDEAAEKVFGENSRVHYNFGSADCIVGIGADYLETWVSPVEFARGWSKGRKPDAHGKMSYVVQIEPRLSLTAANADRWLGNFPGSEVQILRALLALIASDFKKAIPNVLRNEIAIATQGVVPSAELDGTGITLEQLQDVAHRLLVSSRPLVVVGGVAGLASDGVEATALGYLLNALLGSVGETVLVYRATDTSPAQKRKEFLAFLNQIQQKDSPVSVLVVAGVNPAHVLPPSFEFKKSAGRIKTLVALSSQLDETARLAQVVLPVSVPLESWGDSEPLPGVWNLNQPAMSPLYKTESLGDVFLALGKILKIAPEGVDTFYDFIRARWKDRFGANDFEKRWLTWVERGGAWAEKLPESHEATVRSGAGKFVVTKPRTKSAPGLHLISYPSVNFFDGTPANRPWLQETPNPMSTAIWGSWIEMHPETAQQLSLVDKQVVRLQTEQGAVSAPVYVQKLIKPGVLAIPFGQGRTSAGRYGTAVGVNISSIMPAPGDGAVLTLTTSGVKVSPDIAKEELLRLQYSDSQFDRGIARAVPLSKVHHGVPDGHVELEGHHKKKSHSEHELGPQKEPRQMYKQMEHPLYRWAMTVDLASCTGCSACVVACYAENNVPVVGKEICMQGREMAWIHLERYFEDDQPEHPISAFLPMMCQHCGNAPCEPVCPVYATYHNEEGLNSMAYNRCVGTRYCSNNCSYKVRRFNWFLYQWPEPLTWQLNPDVTVREVGVMEKCTFCVQRIRDVERRAKDEGRLVRDGEVMPACASSCPTKAIRFGNLLDESAMVAKDAKSPRSYKILDAEINTQPAVTYLARVENDTQV